MAWEIEYTNEFGHWYDSLSMDKQEMVRARVEQLEQAGPSLGRPAAAAIKGSKNDPQMKELRAGTIRVLFTFNPLRTAILLVGGDKSGQWNAWYRTAIAEADSLYATHLQELRDEGLI